MDALNERVDRQDENIRIMSETYNALETRYNSTINYELTSLDNRLNSLNTLISDDMNHVNITLSGINNATIEICDKIEDH